MFGPWVVTSETQHNWDIPYPFSSSKLKMAGTYGKQDCGQDVHRNIS